MSVSSLKAALFRYGDKVFLAAVVAFVAWNVMSFMSPSEERIGPAVGAAGTPPVEPPETIPDYRKQALAPFDPSQVGKPRKLAHDPFWPQTVEMLQTVVLRKPSEEMEDPEVRAKAMAQAKDTRTLNARLVAQLVPWEIPSYFPRAIYRNYDLILQRMPEMREPCEVRITVDPETRKTITFQAAKVGGLRGFEGQLENENKVRVAVIVWPGEGPTPRQLLGPRELRVEEERLGHVVLRWIEERRPRTDDGKTEYYRATYFNVYRQAQGEEDKRLVARVDGPEAGRSGRRYERPEPAMMEEMPPGYDEGFERRGAPRPPRYLPPPGMPEDMTPEEMMEGGARPRGAPRPEPMPMPREGRQPREEQRPRDEYRAEQVRQGEYVYVDSSVEAETTYTYWVEAVALDEQGEPSLREFPNGTDMAGEGEEFVTAQKFAFAYVGNRMRKGLPVARIVVFIGRRENPLERREFLVPIGGWVGEPPHEPEPEPGAEEGEPPETEARRTGLPPGVMAAADAPGEPLVGEEGETSQNYVTRHVLVDIVPEGRRLLADDTVISSQGKMEKIKTYKYVPKAKIILRDRKNRLRELWHERLKRRRPDERREGRRPRRPRPEEIPPEAYEGIPPDRRDEMMPVPAPRPRRRPRR